MDLEVCGMDPCLPAGPSEVTSLPKSLSFPPIKQQHASYHQVTGDNHQSKDVLPIVRAAENTCHTLEGVHSQGPVVSILSVFSWVRRYGRCLWTWCWMILAGSLFFGSSYPKGGRLIVFTDDSQMPEILEKLYVKCLYKSPRILQRRSILITKFWELGHIPAIHLGSSDWRFHIRIGCHIHRLQVPGLPWNPRSRLN